MPGAPCGPTRIAESANSVRQWLCFRLYFAEQPNCIYPRVHSVVAGKTAPLTRYNSRFMTSHHRHTELIILLGALTALAQASIDMYLPALPTIGSAFAAEPGHVQLSLASFFLGLATGQAFYGPISDRFGRKRPLYAGLVIFALASAC